MRTNKSPRRRVSLWVGAAATAGLVASGVMLSVAATANDVEEIAAAKDGSRNPVDFFADPPDPSEAQLRLLVDGVTRDEYRAAFTNYEECMERSGHALVGVRVDLEIIEYSITDSAVQSGVHQLCYPQEFYQVDREWQIELERKRT